MGIRAGKRSENTVDQSVPGYKATTITHLGSSEAMKITGNVKKNKRPPVASRKPTAWPWRIMEAIDEPRQLTDLGRMEHSMQKTKSEIDKAKMEFHLPTGMPEYETRALS